MRIGFIVFGAFVFFVAGFVMVAPESAEAHGGCHTFKASHNGTDMFNPNGGAAETAKNKLLRSIEAWRQEKGIKRVRIGKVTIKCDAWDMVYILPHHRCYARARVCR